MGFFRYKPYYQPPKDICEICGRDLWGITRYKMRIFLRKKDILYKELVVCEDCLKKARRQFKEDPKVRRLFKLRYRKMRRLEGPWL